MHLQANNDLQELFSYYSISALIELFVLDITPTSCRNGYFSLKCGNELTKRLSNMSTDSC